MSLDVAQLRKFRGQKHRRFRAPGILFLSFHHRLQ